MVPPWLLRSAPVKGGGMGGLDPIFTGAAGGQINDYDYPRQSVAYDPFDAGINNPAPTPSAERLSDSVDMYRLVLMHNLSSPRDLVVHPRKR